jgi:hypothetical protein
MGSQAAKVTVSGSTAKILQSGNQPHPLCHLPFRPVWWQSSCGGANQTVD